jgi:hypothetical protein
LSCLPNVFFFFFFFFLFLDVELALGLSGAIPALLTQDPRTGRAMANEANGGDEDSDSGAHRVASKSIRTGTKVITWLPHK